MSLNERIREATEKRFATQGELAKALGLKDPDVSRRFAGTTNWGVDDLVKISQLCDVSVDYLLGTHHHDAHKIESFSAPVVDLRDLDSDLAVAKATDHAIISAWEIRKAERMLGIAFEMIDDIRFAYTEIPPTATAEAAPPDSVLWVDRRPGEILLVNNLAVIRDGNGIVRVRNVTRVGNYLIATSPRTAPLLVEMKPGTLVGLVVAVTHSTEHRASGV